jgi:hypothetical protein
MSANQALLTHPACREMAERMACELCGDLHPYYDGAVLRFAFLLSDLDRPESRDAWVRWIESRGSRYYTTMGPPRNNPAALLAAILEVSHA